MSDLGVEEFNANREIKVSHTQIKHRQSKGHFLPSSEEPSSKDVVSPALSEKSNVVADTLVSSQERPVQDPSHLEGEASTKEDVPSISEEDIVTAQLVTLQGN